MKLGFICGKPRESKKHIPKITEKGKNYTPETHMS